MRNLSGSQELFAKNIEPDTVYSIEKNKYEIRMVRFLVENSTFLTKMACSGPIDSEARVDKCVRINNTGLTTVSDCKRTVMHQTRQSKGLEVTVASSEIEKWAVKNMKISYIWTIHGCIHSKTGLVFSNLFA